MTALSAPVEPLRIWSRPFAVLWLAVLTAMAGIGMVSPLLPVYVREDLHGPDLAVALSFSGLAVTMIIFAPVAGWLADRHGLKPFIVLGFVVYALGGAGFFFVHSWQLVIAFRMLSGVGAAAVFPMTYAYIGRLAPPGREGIYMGIFSVAEVAGFGAGPLFGGAVRDIFDARTAFATMALLLAGIGLVTLLLLPARPRRPGAAGAGLAVEDEGEDFRDEEDEGPRLPLKQVLRVPMVQAAVAVRTTVSLGWGAGSTFLAVYVVSSDGLNTGSATFVGILLASRSLLGGATQPLTGRLADRINRVTLIVVGLGIAGLGQFFVPDLPRTIVEPGVLDGALKIAPWLLITYIVIGLGEAVAWPAQQALFVEVGREVGMGSIMGLNQMGSSLGFLSGSLVGALVVGVFGLEAVFRYAGIAVVCGVALFWFLMRRAQTDQLQRQPVSEPILVLARD